MFRGDWRLLVAADESGDLPAGGFLGEAELIVAERAQRFGRDEAGLAGRRDHLQHRVLLIARRVVLHHANEMQAEYPTAGNTRCQPKHNGSARAGQERKPSSILNRAFFNFKFV